MSQCMKLHTSAMWKKLTMIIIDNAKKWSTPINWSLKFSVYPKVGINIRNYSHHLMLLGSFHKGLIVILPNRETVKFLIAVLIVSAMSNIGKLQNRVSIIHCHNQSQWDNVSNITIIIMILIIIKNLSRIILELVEQWVIIKNR